MAEIKYDEINEKAYEDAEKHKPGSDTTVVELPNSYDRDIVEAVNVLCDSLCAEDVDPGKTAEEALAFLGTLLVEPMTLVQKSITENGVYDPADDEADGYSSVNVVVPPVVPTLISKSITENGDYSAAADEADGYSSVSVNVSGGGGGGLPANIVYGSFETPADADYVNQIDINTGYTGSGYIVDLYIFPISPVIGRVTSGVTYSNNELVDMWIAKNPYSSPPSYSGTNPDSCAYYYGQYKSNSYSITQGSSSALIVYKNENISSPTTPAGAIRIISDKVFRIHPRDSSNVNDVGFKPGFTFGYIAVFR